MRDSSVKHERFLGVINRLGAKKRLLYVFPVKSFSNLMLFVSESLSDCALGGFFDEEVRRCIASKGVKHEKKIGLT